MATHLVTIHDRIPNNHDSHQVCVLHLVSWTYEYGFHQLLLMYIVDS
jgi:hypothetical protein